LHFAFEDKSEFKILPRFKGYLSYDELIKYEIQKNCKQIQLSIRLDFAFSQLGPATSKILFCKFRGELGSAKACFKRGGTSYKEVWAAQGQVR
jgi:hypothetical protein